MEILRSNRRTLALHIRWDGRLIVRAPRSAADPQIHRFVHQHGDWIETTRQRVLEKQKRAEAWRTQFPHEDGHYRALALPLFTGRCEFYASSMGVSYRKIALSDAASRWGSRSPQGRLRFNWRLVMAPPRRITAMPKNSFGSIRSGAFNRTAVCCSIGPYGRTQAVPEIQDRRRGQMEKNIFRVESDTQMMQMM